MKNLGPFCPDFTDKETEAQEGKELVQVHTVCKSCFETRKFDFRACDFNQKGFSGEDVGIR